MSKANELTFQQPQGTATTDQIKKVAWAKLAQPNLNSCRKMGPAHHFSLFDFSSYADDGRGPSYTETDKIQPLSIVSAVCRQLRWPKRNLTPAYKSRHTFTGFQIVQTLSAQLALGYKR